MRRLLFVDDDRSFTQAFGEMFSEKGFEVDILSNGDSLAALLREQEFDVVILDNHLQGKSGVEILHLLNKLEEDTGWRKPPVVLLTGDGSEDMELRARLAKTDFFLLKPCNFRELEERVEEALKKKETQNRSRGKKESAGRCATMVGSMPQAG